MVNVCPAIAREVAVVVAAAVVGGSRRKGRRKGGREAVSTGQSLPDPRRDNGTAA